jgi:hypothetical protein
MNLKVGIDIFLISYLFIYLLMDIPSSNYSPCENRI